MNNDGAELNVDRVGAFSFARVPPEIVLGRKIEPAFDAQDHEIRIPRC